jgi:hypothetical protein
MRLKKGAAHRHCWHYEGGWHNGLGTSGGDKFRCCWCDEFKEHPFVIKQDPKHGPHGEQNKIRVYTDGFKP